MPSPVAHAAIGYLIYRVCRAKLADFPTGYVWVVVALSLLPDMDAALGIVFGNLGRYHNHMMSSPAFGALVALLCGLIGYWRTSRFRLWFALAFISYILHIAMDYFTVGRGIMLLWPFSSERFQPPFELFYGLHWSDGWLTIRHVYTLVTELGSIAVLAVVLHLATRSQRQAATTCPPADKSPRSRAQPLTPSRLLKGIKLTRAR